MISSPERIGMQMSVITISGQKDRIISSPSAPFPASRTSVMPCAFQSAKQASPFRIMTSSSMISILYPIAIHLLLQGQFHGKPLAVLAVQFYGTVFSILQLQVAGDKADAEMTLRELPFLQQPPLQR